MLLDSLLMGANMGTLSTQTCAIKGGLSNHLFLFFFFFAVLVSKHCQADQVFLFLFQSKTKLNAFYGLGRDFCVLKFTVCFIAHPAYLILISDEKTLGYKAL